MSTIYDVGDEIRISFAFTDSAGTATDPTTVTIIIKNGDQIVETYIFGVDPEIVKDSVGNYHVDYIIPTKGYWSYNVVGSGILNAAGIEFFISKA